MCACVCAFLVSIKVSEIQQNLIYTDSKKPNSILFVCQFLNSGYQEVFGIAGSEIADPQLKKDIFNIQKFIIRKTRITHVMCGIIEKIFDSPQEIIVNHIGSNGN